MSQIVIEHCVVEEVEKDIHRQANDSTSPDGPGLGSGSVRSGPTVRSDWTEPKTGSLGLDGLGLDQSAHACNFDIVS